MVVFPIGGGEPETTTQGDDPGHHTAQTAGLIAFWNQSLSDSRESCFNRQVYPFGLRSAHNIQQYQYISGFATSRSRRRECDRGPVLGSWNVTPPNFSVTGWHEWGDPGVFGGDHSPK